MAVVTITIKDTESGLNFDIKHSNLDDDDELTGANVLGQALYKIGCLDQLLFMACSVEKMYGTKQNYGKH